MDRLLVTGGRRLDGTVPIGGAKNSALKLMAAAMLADGRTLLRTVPDIQDCHTMADVLRHLGVGVERRDHDVAIDVAGALTRETPYELVRRMRASILVLGPLLAREGRARVAMPGGCNIGSRGIDLHIRGLARMGAAFSSSHGYLEGEARELRGAVVSLDFPSEMGARIDGVGTPTIQVEGVDRFTPVEHAVIPDRIEAGTYAMAACITGGEVVLDGARADHLDLVLSKLAELGARVDIEERGIRIAIEEPARAVDLVTLPYPGFPTDLQPPIMALLATADGTSIITENVFESRFMFVDELARMGADI